MPLPVYLVNLSKGQLTQWAIRIEKDSHLTDLGALSVNSYEKKGRSPKDKRIVDTPLVHDDVDWGKTNMPITPESFKLLRHRAVEFLNKRERLFVICGYLGWTKAERLKVRVIASRPYHALFMHNMLVMPTPEELANFGEADYTIYNAGEEWNDPTIPGTGTKTCVALNFDTREQVILGTQYAGEMKKGMLTVAMYVCAKRNHLCMHASANVGQDGDVSVFFGLSGTGKTTLSADPKRALIGDDEHVWTPSGIHNLEGGCYAKAIGLSPKTEPEIYHAIKFGAVAENCVLKSNSSIDYNDITLTENTRVAYPLEYIPNARIPAMCGHAKHVIFLTNDAFGVMPPVSLLNRGQAMFWFVTGYTAKVAGTEVGIKDPVPAFSPCFGGPFLVMHPTVYGRQLAEKLEQYNAKCWLVNTGWSGGKFGTGKRMSLKVTRAIIDAIHDGSLEKEEFETLRGWGLRIPKSCRNVPARVLNPFNAWTDKAAFVKQIDILAEMFAKNFKKYERKATPEMLAAIPKKWNANAKL